jgi:hypothetical protein
MALLHNSTSPAASNANARNAVIIQDYEQWLVHESSTALLVTRGVPCYAEYTGSFFKQKPDTSSTANIFIGTF